MAGGFGCGHSGRGDAPVVKPPRPTTFYVEGGRVRIVPRRRGAPLDKLVSEMMILANSSWGGLLAERDVAAIYRAQSTGKVRFSGDIAPLKQKNK